MKRREIPLKEYQQIHGDGGALPGGPITWSEVFAEKPNDEATLRKQVDRIRTGLDFGSER